MAYSHNIALSQFYFKPQIHCNPHLSNLRYLPQLRIKFELQKKENNSDKPGQRKGSQEVLDYNRPFSMETAELKTQASNPTFFVDVEEMSDWPSRQSLIADFGRQVLCYD